MRSLRPLLSTIDLRTLRFFALAALTVIAVSLFFWFSARLVGVGDGETLRNLFTDLAESWWGLPIVVAVFVAAAFVGTPQFVLIAMVVATFGPVLGFGYAYVATMVSAALTFLLARWLGSGWFKGARVSRLEGVSDLIAQNGFLAALIVRIVPSAPFIVVNSALGLTRISVAAYMGGTAVGIVPKMAIIALFGKVIEQARAGDPSAIASLALALAIWVALAFIVKRVVSRVGDGPVPLTPSPPPHRRVIGQCAANPRCYS